MDLATLTGVEIHEVHVIDEWQYSTGIERAGAPLRWHGEVYVVRLPETAADADLSVTAAIPPEDRVCWLTARVTAGTTPSMLPGDLKNIRTEKIIIMG